MKTFILYYAEWLIRLVVVLAVFCGCYPLGAQSLVCRTGLSYERIYESNEYGAGNYYRVNAVAPYSPADYSGVRPGDIIEAVNGISTNILTLEQIGQLLTSERQYLLELRREDTILRLSISPECKRDEEVTERELAWLFSGYSPNDVTDGSLRYLYTGIVYKRDNLPKIADIELGSPALKAGLLPGDIIKKINGIEFDQSSLGELLSSYLSFLNRMQPYRSEAIGEKGEHLASWFSDAYADVAEQMRRDKNDAVMSYLFAFRPYVSLAPSEVLLFEIDRAGTSYEVEIKGMIREETCIQPKHNR